MAVSALEILKKLPQTNCRECGQSTCMAFATHVVVEGEDITKCPYLPEVLRAKIGEVQTQQQQGVGRRRDSLAIAMKFLQEKVQPLPFADLAAGLGADYGQEAGREFLEFPFFEHQVQVFKDEVRYLTTSSANPWNAILLYNYIASGGRKLPTDQWITFQSMPNSVSKAKTLDRLEKKLAAYFSGKSSLLQERAQPLGRRAAAVAEDADLQFIFQPLPRVPVLLLFWEAEEEENFVAQAHFLFNANVPDYLDLESLLFLVEHIIDFMMEKK